MVTIGIAGHAIGFDNRYPTIEHLSREFVVSREPEAIFAATDEECLAERVDGCDWPMGLYESSALHRKAVEWLMANDDILLMHGVALRCNGRAYIFTARSGVGKTTHVRQWLRAFPEETEVVNGDKPLLSFAADGTVTAYGTPWRGKEGMGGNASAPLAGIVVVRRGQVNSIRRMHPIEALPTLMEQIHRSGREPVEQARRQMELVRRLQGLPIYELRCTPDTEAARVCRAGIEQS